MLRIGDLEKLREAHRANSDLSAAAAHRQIGDPPIDAVVAFAVDQMANPDRNVRVLALRVLAHHRGPLAARGLLAGLGDEKRRVCAVAIQACGNYLDDVDIVASLEAIARDAKAKRKLRRRALSMLAGDEGRLQDDLSEPAASALRRLMSEEPFRFAIVFGLARLDLAPRVNAILKDFVKSKDGREREMARRALAGERVIHIDGYAADEALQRRIMASCDRAHGRMYYWLPRAE